MTKPVAAQRNKSYLESKILCFLKYDQANGNSASPPIKKRIKFNSTGLNVPPAIFKAISIELNKNVGIRINSIDLIFKTLKASPMHKLYLQVYSHSKTLRVNLLKFV